MDGNPVSVVFERKSTGSRIVIESDDNIFISPTDDPNEWVPVNGEIEWKPLDK